jgi:hypothetical protein
MNGERFLLLVLVLACLLPLLAALPVFADPQVEPMPTVPQPELPSGAGFLLALDAVLAHVSITERETLPAPGTRWTVTPQWNDDAEGYCYLAEGWRVCIVASASDGPGRVYHVQMEHPERGFGWLGRVDELGQIR